MSRVAFQFCPPRPCFSPWRCSSFPFSSYSTSLINASAGSPSHSRRLALFQLGTVLPRLEILSANAKLSRTDGTKSESSTSITNSSHSTRSVSENNILEWPKIDNRRLLHVVFRVGDLDKTIKFYTECLGMKVLRKRDIPEEAYSNAFLGYGPEDSNFAMELTYNYGVDKYDIGNGFGNFGFVVENVSKLADLIKFKGGTVTREPGVAEDGSATVGIVEDPDGYRCELIERSPTLEPLCHITLQVGDLDRSIDFYKKAVGMELLQKRDYPEERFTIATLGYGSEDKNTVLQLRYNYGIREYDKGTGYGQIAIGTDDVYKTAQTIEMCGGQITREPGPLPGINTKITVCLDPDGWKTVFVDNVDFLKELQ